MLSQREKDGATRLLSVFTLQDLMSLVRTVTRNQIVATSKDDAIRAIVRYTEKPVELLRRQKVKRDLLFRYLSREQQDVSPNADKTSLVRQVLGHWGVETFADGELMELEYEDDSDQWSSTSASDQLYHPGPSSSSTSSAAASSSTDHLNHTQGQVPSTAVRPDHSEEMARQFAGWFYQMLNSYHPNSQEAPCENFGPQHFFPDCNLKILCVSPSESREEVQGGDVVSQRLLQFVKKEELRFNPNVSPSGVKGQTDPYGLTVLMVCGTVHSGSRAIGIFQQQFGLIRDPTMDNNWRVKYSKLKLAAENTSSMPTLTQTQQSLALEY